ncbi:hypothetical protein CGCFRS4_v016061 [Colletotrichum fructicola]|nr:hypothetical protein CGCFRS4_v016061 [Colletotrichum fructicola]
MAGLFQKRLEAGRRIQHFLLILPVSAGERTAPALKRVGPGVFSAPTLGLMQCWTMEQVWSSVYSVEAASHKYTYLA